MICTYLASSGAIKHKQDNHKRNRQPATHSASVILLLYVGFCHLVNFSRLYYLLLLLSSVINAALIPWLPLLYSCRALKAWCHYMTV